MFLGPGGSVQVAKPTPGLNRLVPVARGFVGLPPSAVAASRALQPWVLQPTLPSMTPRAGDTKLGEAGWRASRHCRRRPRRPGGGCSRRAGSAGSAPAWLNASAPPPAGTPPKTRVECARIGRSPSSPRPRGHDLARAVITRPVQQPPFLTTLSATRGYEPVLTARQNRDLRPGRPSAAGRACAPARRRGAAGSGRSAPPASQRRKTYRRATSGRGTGFGGRPGPPPAAMPLAPRPGSARPGR